MSDSYNVGLFITTQYDFDQYMSLDIPLLGDSLETSPRCFHLAAAFQDFDKQFKTQYVSFFTMNTNVERIAIFNSRTADLMVDTQDEYEEWSSKYSLNDGVSAYLSKLTVLKDEEILLMLKEVKDAIKFIRKKKIKFIIADACFEEYDGFDADDYDPDDNAVDNMYELLADESGDIGVTYCSNEDSASPEMLLAMLITMERKLEQAVQEPDKIVVLENKIWSSVVRKEGAMYPEGIDGAKKAFELQDYKAAFELFKKESELDNFEAMYYLAILYSGYYRNDLRNEDLSLYWYQKSGEHGNCFAQYALGLGYDQQTDFIGGLPKVMNNDQMALYWYKKAAEQGYAFAQFRLAQMYSGEQRIYWLKKVVDHDVNLVHMGDKFFCSQNFREIQGDAQQTLALNLYQGTNKQ